MLKSFNKLGLLIMLTLLLATLLGACGDSTATPASATTGSATSGTTAAGGNATTAAGGATAAPGSPVAAPTVTPYPTVPQPAGAIKLTFWHGFSGFNAAVLQQVVNKFNSSQSKYYVEAIAQGGDYDATFNKFNTTLAGGNLPNMIQMFDIGTQRMIDTNKVIPAQDLIDRDKTTFQSDLEPAVASYYTVNNKLYSIPLNSSAPVMYFNKKAFADAGIDTNKVEWTYDEVLDAAKKLTVKDASGKVTRYGAVFTLYSWIFEEEMAGQGVTFADPNNGRQGRANKLVFNNAAGVNWLNFLKGLQDQGLGQNVGRDSGTTNGTARDAAFTTGNAAITFNSIAALRGYISSADKAGKGVNVGVAYLPKPAGAKGGVIIGGASLWMINTGTPDQQAGSWAFAQFVAQPDIQAFFASNTGYYPTRKAAYSDPVMQDALKKYPQFQTAVNELRATEASSATQGAVFGTFVTTRQNVEAAMEQYLSGKASTAQSALDSAASKSNDTLSEYNSTVK